MRRWITESLHRRAFINSVLAIISSTIPSNDISSQKRWSCSIVRPFCCLVGLGNLTKADSCKSAVISDGIPASAFVGISSLSLENDDRSRGALIFFNLHYSATAFYGTLQHVSS